MYNIHILAQETSTINNIYFGTYINQKQRGSIKEFMKNSLKNKRVIILRKKKVVNRAATFRYLQVQ